MGCVAGSPRLCRFLAEAFGPERQARLDRLAGLRAGRRRSGADTAAVREWTENWIKRRGFLPYSAKTATTLDGTVFKAPRAPA